MKQNTEKVESNQALCADSAITTAKKLPWEKPEFASVQPLSETHAIGGIGPDGGANQS